MKVSCHIYVNDQASSLIFAPSSVKRMKRIWPGGQMTFEMRDGDGE